MASRGNAEVAYYDEAEATLAKEAEVFDGFVYDNEADGGILSLFEEIRNKMDTLRGDVEGLHGQYAQLQALYDTFTNFNETMESIIKRMNSSLDVMEGRVTSVITTAQNAVEDHMSTDATLMSDLEQLNDMLGISNGDDWNQSGASFRSGAAATAPAAE